MNLEPYNKKFHYYLNLLDSRARYVFSAVNQRLIEVQHQNFFLPKSQNRDDYSEEEVEMDMIYFNILA